MKWHQTNQRVICSVGQQGPPLIDNLEIIYRLNLACSVRIVGVFTNISVVTFI